MKTNQNMIRKMGNFDVTQRTKDGMFNATMLLKQWNESTGSEKELKKFFINKQTDEFINVLVNEENLHGYNSTYVKSRASRGKNAGTWMHPFLFIKFAMWINPRFEYQVIKFVYDEMVKYRKEAGSAYIELGKAISKLVAKDFMPRAMQKVSEAINFVVFNEHESSIRNKYGNEEKQRELYELEKKITDLINEGFINNYDNVVSYLRKQWQTKNNPKVFLNN